METRYWDDTVKRRLTEEEAQILLLLWDAIQTAGNEAVSRLRAIGWSLDDARFFAQERIEKAGFRTYGGK